MSPDAADPEPPGGRSPIRTEENPHVKLELRGITKRFGTFTANDSIDLVVEPERSMRSWVRTARASRPS